MAHFGLNVFITMGNIVLHSTINEHGIRLLLPISDRLVNSKSSRKCLPSAGIEPQILQLIITCPDN